MNTDGKMPQTARSENAFIAPDAPDAQAVIDVAYNAVDLPHDIERAVAAGDYRLASQLIERRIAHTLSPSMRCRLEAERRRCAYLEGECYPYSYGQAVQMFLDEVPQATPEQFEEFFLSGALDWVYKRSSSDEKIGHPDETAKLPSPALLSSNTHGLLTSVEQSHGAGKEMIYFHELFLETLTKVRMKLDDENTLSRSAYLNDRLHAVKQKGYERARITVKVSIDIKEHLKCGELLTAHLPVPRPTPSTQDAHARGLAPFISNVQVLETSHPDFFVAPEGAPARTVCLQGVDTTGPFWITYSYEICAPYTKLDPREVVRDVSKTMSDLAFLSEELPHIPFDPSLVLRAQEIVGSETNPLLKARLIYNEITQYVSYAYVRPYAGILSTARYAAANLQGDCGVQASLFIALCRIVGIPAAWESGLYVSPRDGIQWHDWARFYIEPYGWLWADCSFGGSAYRMRERERHDYYFGNCDALRMVANSQMCAPFNPPKRFDRIDPTDNQKGEIESHQKGFCSSEVVDTQELISYEYL